MLLLFEALMQAPVANLPVKISLKIDRIHPSQSICLYKGMWWKWRSTLRTSRSPGNFLFSYSTCCTTSFTGGDWSHVCVLHCWSNCQLRFARYCHYCVFELCRGDGWETCGGEGVEGNVANFLEGQKERQQKERLSGGSAMHSRFDYPPVCLPNCAKKCAGTQQWMFHDVQWCSANPPQVRLRLQWQVLIQRYHNNVL